VTRDEFLALDDFTKAYIICALWSTNDESDDSGGDPLDQNYEPEDIDPDTLNRMVEDCQQFQRENSGDLALYASPEWTPAELGGHDFWLTRNGYGAGFWDRDCLPEEAGKRLTEASEKFGEFDLYVGDDGVIYNF